MSDLRERVARIMADHEVNYVEWLPAAVRIISLIRALKEKQDV